MCSSPSKKKKRIGSPARSPSTKNKAASKKRKEIAEKTESIRQSKVKSGTDMMIQRHPIHSVLVRKLDLYYSHSIQNIKVHVGIRYVSVVVNYCVLC